MAIQPLFSQLCQSILAQTCADGEGQDGPILTSFESPGYKILRHGLEHKNVIQHLLKTTFDLILLRKWMWFASWQTNMEPESWCLSHTYEMIVKGRHKDAVRLEAAVSTLMEKGPKRYPAFY